MPTLHEAMARSACVGRLYFKIDVGGTVFYGGGSHFLHNNQWGGSPVYPVVARWGELVKEMGPDGGSESAVITLFSEGYWVPATSTVRKTVAQWLRELQLREVAVSVFQWNEEVTTQLEIFRGYVKEVGPFQTMDGVPVVDLSMSGSPRTLEQTPMTQLITKAVAPTAPNQSLGLMFPVQYGNIPNKLFAGAPRNSVGMIGHPMSGARGVIVAENVTEQTVLLRLQSNDGSDPSKQFQEPSTANDWVASNIPLDGDLWVYDPSLGAYGLVDASSYVPTNDNSRVDCAVAMSPRVYFFLRPSKAGSTLSSGFINSINKLVNSDITDYVESDATNFIWSFECPEASSQGKVRSVSVLVDWLNGHATENRSIKFGLWDIFGSAGADYLDVQSSTFGPRSAGLSRIMVGSTSKYDAWNFRSSAHEPGGGTTQAEFRAGRFVTRGNADGEEATMELRCEVMDLGGVDAGRDGVRLYHLIMVVEVEYPQLPIFNFRTWHQRYNRVDEADDATLRRLWDEEKWARRRFQIDKILGRQDITDRIRGTDFFGTGAYQQDTGAGLYTGTVDAAIERPCDIAHHILHKRSGRAVNVATGTLGNFVDARDTILFNISVLASFSPDDVKRLESIQILNRTTPMTVIEDNGEWQCIPEDMNPDPSCLYRSASDPRWIGPHDILEGTFECDQIQDTDLINSVQVNHAHGYPNREAGLSTVYDHPLSQMHFGKKTTEPIDAPMVTNKQYDSGPDSGAIAYAQWQGRRSARPLLLPYTHLTQAFYDLRRGHILEFRDLEDVGIHCKAFNCGFPDYYFKSQTDTVNQATSAAPSYVQVGSTSSLSLGFSQQVESVTFLVAVAAAYTTVANSWKYSDPLGVMTSFGDANTTNKDALKSTGTQTVRFVRPAFTSWGKTERTFGAFGVAGPCYWLDMEYSAAGTAGTGSGRITHEAIWVGRGFRAMRVSRVPSGRGNYMAVAAQFREVM